MVSQLIGSHAARCLKAARFPLFSLRVLSDLCASARGLLLFVCVPKERVSVVRVCSWLEFLRAFVPP